MSENNREIFKPNLKPNKDYVGNIKASGNSIECKQLIAFLKTYFEIYLVNDFEIDELIMNIANLSIYGWKKEAIPTTKLKNSLITRIFKSLFG